LGDDASEPSRRRKRDRQDRPARRDLRAHRRLRRHGVAGDRANKYVDLDVYNESYHTGSTVAGSYWNVYSPAGIADIYRQARDVAPNTRMYVNEYNVYADTNDGSKFANYYASHIESLRNAGFTAGYGDVVGGIGTQYYANNVAIDNDDPNRIGAANGTHNPARLMQTLQTSRRKACRSRSRNLASRAVRARRSRRRSSPIRCG
jgi:hypothetical protein